MTVFQRITMQPAIWLRWHGHSSGRFLPLAGTPIRCPLIPAQKAPVDETNQMTETTKRAVVSLPKANATGDTVSTNQGGRARHRLFEFLDLRVTLASERELPTERVKI